MTRTSFFFVVGALTAAASACSSAPPEAGTTTTSKLVGDPCTTNEDCAGLEYCVKPAGACAAQGTCERRPINVMCVSRVEPQCGCDGVTYDNDCLASKAGASIDHAGACSSSTGGDDAGAGGGGGECDGGGPSTPDPACAQDTDCAGILPMMCRLCDDGSAACAHWSCASGACQIAFCPE